MTTLRLSTLLSLLGCVSLPAGAEQIESDGSPQPLNLSEVVISATRTPETIASIPGAVQVIDAQQIGEQSGPGRRVSDILGQLVPGLAPSSGGMSNFGQTLRGRNMLVLIDGVSQNATRDNFRQLNSISPGSIERIEIVSGASSIYGAGASGGILNIITKRNSGQGIAFSSRLGMTSADQLSSNGMAYEVFQSATGRQNTLDWYVSSNLTQRNDQFDGNGKRVPQDTSQGSNMDTDTYDLQGRFGYELDATKKISLSLQDYKDRQDTDYTKDRGNKTQAVAVHGLQLDHQPYTHNQAVNLNYTDQDFFGQGLQLENYWRRADALFFPDLSRGKAGVSDNNSVQDVYGLRMAIDSQAPSIGPATGRLVWGADYDHERSRQRGDQYVVDGLTYTRTGTTFELGPDLQTTTRALFGQLSYDIADWTLRGGVRRTWIESEVSDSIAYGEIVQTGNRSTLKGGTLKYDDTLYNLGAVYYLTPHQEVFANFSQGFSLPDIQRYLRDVNSRYDIDQLNAQALKVDSRELGWRGNWNQWQALVTAYENTSDVTQFYDANDRVLRLINQKERVRGIESNLTYRASERWSLGGTYGWAKGETRQKGKWIDLPATRISPAKSTLFLAYHGHNHAIRLQSMQLQNYKAAFNDNNGRKIKGYTLLDLLGSVNLPVGKLEGGVYNLTNRNYQNLFAQANARAPYANAQGRTLGVSYALDW
ncbi:MAG TPA: TonB-dependent receptor [Pseudomonas sp.]|uniref:TonB-dependent receptor n=1 Tax=Pseudomonas sp. TaxID=306 RepID=UPI002EDB32E3